MEAAFWVKISSKEKYGRIALGAVSANILRRPPIDSGEIAVKLRFEIPDEVFKEPTFEAKIVIPKAIREVPDRAEVARSLGAEMGKQLGIRVRVEIPEAPAGL